MYAVSEAYKKEMRKVPLRDHSYIRVSIGVINQEAQADAAFWGNYAYFSNLHKPLDNYAVETLYATCEQDFSAVDGTMYFLPREQSDAVLNQGAVSEEILGGIEIHFSVPYNLRGLTIEFGKAYPVDFKISSDNKELEITENASGHFVTEEIFQEATFLRFTPERMVNGASRLRIHQITMGIGIYFSERDVLSSTKKEYVSPISEELPSIDFALSINNKNRAYDIENENSTVNFLELGQDVEVTYGQELENGSVEWLPSATVALKEWSADDEVMSFTATDRFDNMTGTYYGGEYSAEGISLYDLAIRVFDDAGTDSRTYWVDEYLKTIKVHNPVPVVAHKEALQLIANAGRCVLMQNRAGRIIMKSSFIPEMSASSDNETYFSHAAGVLGKFSPEEYALAAENHGEMGAGQFFLPREAEGMAYLGSSYISEAVADDAGNFIENPTVRIMLESAFKCLGMTLRFGRNPPKQLKLRSYKRDGEELLPVETVALQNEGAELVVSWEFAEFNELVIEFTKGAANNRVTLETVSFGDATDYELAYGSELTKTPKGTQLSKVRELGMVRTMYSLSKEEAKELAKETVTAEPVGTQYTFYFSTPSYGYAAELENPQAGLSVEIVNSSSYFATVEVLGASGDVEVIVNGKEYVQREITEYSQLNPSGAVETWKNPLVSGKSHARDMLKWVGDYLKSDREYELSYRGEPRIDGNDIVFLENKYVPGMLVRVYEHTLKYNGTLSGSIKARRDMSYVEGT